MTARKVTFFPSSSKQKRHRRQLIACAVMTENMAGVRRGNFTDTSRFNTTTRSARAIIQTNSRAESAKRHANPNHDFTATAPLSGESFACARPYRPLSSYGRFPPSRVKPRADKLATNAPSFTPSPPTLIGSKLDSETIGTVIAMSMTFTGWLSAKP